MLREIRSQRKSIIRQEQSAAMGEAPAGEEGWDWETLADNARDYLSAHGKDLEPMAVLIEAMVRIDGPSGLAAAMGLLAELVEAFWDRGLYPAEDDDGVATRFQPLSGLSGGSGDKDGALIQPIRRMVLAAAGGDQLRYLDKVRADAVMAASQTGSPEQKEARVQEAEEAYRGAESLTQRIPRRSLAAVIGEVDTAETCWRRAIGFISERTKPQFPAASRVSDELRALREWLESLLAKLPPDPTEAVETAAEEGAETGGEAAAPAAGGAGFVAGKISRREDALKAISAAAEYFLTHEPQSPLGSTLREVDRRARMGLHDFLAELIPDESVRETFYWRSGIRPPAEKSQNE
nr:type VI secretion system ImpA family N-terminal domain-containing protein [Sphingomonas sp. dw_22]